MVVYKCDRCNKEFDPKCNFRSHKNRKFPCQNITINGAIEPTVKDQQHAIIDAVDGSHQQKEYKCTYCNKSFAFKNSLKRHVQNRCNIKQQIEKDKEVIFEKLMAEMNEIKKENKRLRSALQKTNAKCKSININNTNTTNNGTINYNSIKLIAFGKERDIVKTFKKADVIKAINGFGTEAALTKLIHYNEEHPECHNVYSRNLKDKYAMIHDGERWQSKLKSDVIDEIYGFNRDYVNMKKIYKFFHINPKIYLLNKFCVEENLEEFLKSLDDSRKKSLRRWLALDDADEKIKKIRDEIRLLLYNEKDMVIKQCEATTNQLIDESR